MIEFTRFGKIGRFSRPCIITEKIDGTNASVFIDPDGPILAASRSCWITPEKDNHGFARWVQANETELRKLGPGRHFGEWWGQGINRGYGLKEKRFSLFNTSIWNDETKPACCHVVPVLHNPNATSDMDYLPIHQLLELLISAGSLAAPGYKNPEGIIIFHTGTNTYFKKTIFNDEANIQLPPLVEVK